MVDFVPTRPKRQNKNIPKDETGLLMSVIRALTLSQNVEERDREKKNLEKNFKLSNEKLEYLVSVHHNDLSQVLTTFSKIPQKISESRQRLKNVRERLSHCRSLLLCKRDEVKKLWQEVMECKHTLEIFNEIEDFTSMPERIQSYIDTQHYLHATQQLVSVSSTMNGPMKSIEGLKEVKEELFNKHDELFEHIIKDLHKQLYEVSTLKVLKKARIQNLDYKYDAFEDNKGEVNKIEDFLNEDILINPTENIRHFITLLIYCLFLLKRLPDAVQSIKEQCRKEMMAIVWRTPPVLMEILPNLRLKNYRNEKKEASILRAFLDLVFEQFKVVLALHQWILLILVYIGKDNPVPPYDLNEIWSRVQGVVELLVAEYLDISNANGTPGQGSATLSDLSANINYYFSKKRAVKQKHISLFKFDASSHALSMNAYINEQKEALIKRGEFWNYSESTHHQYVCDPSCKNIVFMFNTTMKFIQEVETSLALQLGDQCPLKSSLLEYARVFLNQLTVQIDNTIDMAIKEMETGTFSCDLDVQKDIGVSRPILQSTIIIYNGLQELEDLFTALPLYSSDFYSLICKILTRYKETCLNAFRSIVQHESHDKRIISATWAKDEDISRYLKSLPTWIALQNQKSNTSSTDIEESPEEVNLRNKKVSEILTSNITGDTLIPQHEILSDIVKLRNMGHLHESMEWLGNQLLNLANSLPCSDKISGLVPKKLKDVTPFSKMEIETLTGLAQDFDNLADTCLLVLYLEARVHCFYHLLPITTKDTYCITLDTQEPDSEVMKLIKDLSSIEEELVHTLLSRKLRCIFEGLGHLLASIFINYVGKLKKINENGIKKICRNIYALQQSLTSITKSREVALDRARQYYELLYQTSEEVLNSILDYGPQFNELEYSNILRLIHHSRSNFDQYTLDQELKRLVGILSNVSVQL